MRRLLALALTTVAATTVALPATTAHAAGGCSGVVDTTCTYTRCLANDCFYDDCTVYVNPTQTRNAGICLG